MTALPTIKPDKIAAGIMAMKPDGCRSFQIGWRQYSRTTPFQVTIHDDYPNGLGCVMQDGATVEDALALAVAERAERLKAEQRLVDYAAAEFGTHFARAAA